MARATHLTIGTADRIRLDARCNDHGNDHDEDGGNTSGGNEVRQEVQVSVTYALDPGDTDLTALAAEKAGEVQRAHEAAWNRIGALGNGGPGNTPCACRSTCSDLEEDGVEKDDDREDGPDDDPQGAGTPPAFPPAVPPAGAWYLPGASRPSGGTGSPKADSEPPAEPDAEPVTGPQKILIRSRAGKTGLSAYALESLLYQQFKVWRVERLTKEQAASLLDALERDLKEREAKEREKKETEKLALETGERNGTHGSPAGAGGCRAA